MGMTAGQGYAAVSTGGEYTATGTRCCDVSAGAIALESCPSGSPEALAVSTGSGSDTCGRGAIAGRVLAGGGDDPDALAMGVVEVGDVPPAGLRRARREVSME